MEIHIKSIKTIGNPKENLGRQHSRRAGTRFMEEGNTLYRVTFSSAGNAWLACSAAVVLASLVWPAP